ncbi:MAG: hypothetical protein IPM96_22095 [Ignavibacteria bacterium]|nr:hypothetical protein [Ignavibacteria bacterium]
MTGWKAFGGVKETTDGGVSWLSQTLPSGGNIITSQINKFSFVNNDTIWGVGGFIQYPGIGFRGMIYRTTKVKSFFPCKNEKWLSCIFLRNKVII